MEMDAGLGQTCDHLPKMDPEGANYGQTNSRIEAATISQQRRANREKVTTEATVEMLHQLKLENEEKNVSAMLADSSCSDSSCFIPSPTRRARARPPPPPRRRNADSSAGSNSESDSDPPPVAFPVIPLLNRRRECFKRPHRQRRPKQQWSVVDVSGATPNGAHQRRPVARRHPHPNRHRRPRHRRHAKVPYHPPPVEEWMEEARQKAQSSWVPGAVQPINYTKMLDELSVHMAKRLHRPDPTQMENVHLKSGLIIQVERVSLVKQLDGCAFREAKTISTSLLWRGSHSLMATTSTTL